MNNFGNMQNLMEQFSQYVRNYNNQLAPQQMVQQLLDSGKMSQQQFNWFSALANKIISTDIFKRTTF